MNGRCAGLWLLAMAVGGGWSGSALAAPPWSSLIPFSKVEADPKKSYALTDNQGPWMIMAATFTGEGADQQAQELAVELRKKFKLEAYTFVRKIDDSTPQIGLGLNKYGEPKKMRAMNPCMFNEVAVMVGNYTSVDDSRAQKALQTLKYAWPATLDVNRRNTAHSMAGLREVQRRLNPKERDKGPMRMAMLCPNPTIPEEYFRQGGVDKLVIAMNRGVEFSLLECPRRYSVRVATFRGKDTMLLDEIDKLTKSKQVSDKLAEGAEKAHLLTTALREMGYEAYEFHDRHESIVTVGSFDSVGDPRSDGKTEINPGVHQILEKFKAKPVKNLPTLAAGALRPEKLKGIAFDVQPIPIAVPQRSIGSEYAREE